MADGNGTAGISEGARRYARHCPEQRLLYQLVEQHYPRLLATLAEQDQSLPKYVREEFEAYLPHYCPFDE